MWNQHLQNETNEWDIMEKDYPNKFTVSGDLLLGEKSVTFLSRPETEHKIRQQVFQVGRTN